MSLAQVNLMHIVLIGPTLILLGTENELINKFIKIYIETFCFTIFNNDIFYSQNRLDL